MSNFEYFKNLRDPDPQAYRQKTKEEEMPEKLGSKTSPNNIQTKIIDQFDCKKIMRSIYLKANSCYFPIRINFKRFLLVILIVVLRLYHRTLDPICEHKL